MRPKNFIYDYFLRSPYLMSRYAWDRERKKISKCQIGRHEYFDIPCTATGGSEYKNRFWFCDVTELNGIIFGFEI